MVILRSFRPHFLRLPISAGLVFLTLLLGPFASRSAPADTKTTPPYVWIEGEHPSTTSFTPKSDGVGRPEFLSGDDWLRIAIDAPQVDQATPRDGWLISYDFSVAQGAAYEIWSRIGYEFVRSPFEWRLDDGAWTRVTPDELTTDLMELSYFTEVAWLKLSQTHLTAGPHQLEVRVVKSQDAKGKTDRLLYACDAFCLSAGPFHPNGKFQPGQPWQDAADREAARHVFTFPAPDSNAAQTALPLAGPWEICRHDEQLPGPTAAPIKDFPEEPHWHGIQVPGDKNQLRPDLLFAHRVWYRTRVSVPDDCAGRSFYLVCPENNLNTTVYVNGVFCGFDKNPFARVQIDVSSAMHPGLNEIRVGIKDAWYAYSANPNDPLKLRKKWNLPEKFLGEGFQDLAYPIWRHSQSGILVTPELVCAGPVYTADVFCQPSVAQRALDLEVTLQNGSDQPQSGELLCAAVNSDTSEAEKTFAPRAFELAPRESKTIRLHEAWTNPTLWWPDAPQIYRLRATIQLAGRPADVSQTTFGFREWSADGKDFTLNGIPWHGWADVFTASTPNDWIRFYRDHHETTMRFWGTRWQDLPPAEALDFFDRHGVVVRRSGILDGEAIGYMAVEQDPDLKKESPIKMDLMRNWRDQVVAQVKGERNHPSVMIWSIENEWLYINCLNLWGGLMDEFEAEVLKTSDAVRAADPTRPTMTDGGAANKDNTMPVHGNHYVWDAKNVWRYPGLAYETNPTGGGRGRWTWDELRPRFIGEDYYIAGHHPELSYFTGESAFNGKAGCLPGAGLAARILTEGYRWADCGAFHFWMNQSDTDRRFYQSFAPRAVFCRQWDWTFGSGQTVRRTLGIFNDTHSNDPISFTWTLLVDGKQTAKNTTVHHIPPGRNEKFDIMLPLSEVEQRAEGQWRLSLSVGGQEVFTDSKDISILKPSGFTDRPKADELLVFDPKGAVSAFLKARAISFTSLDALTNLPAGGKILVVGPDALSPRDSTSSALAAYALHGKRVIVLDQANPLKYQGLRPAEMQAAQNQGRTAFAEDLDHPALRHLKQKDFFTWGPDEVVYRNAYDKPSRGARSLIQCHDLLRNTALVEVPVGQGLMILCQLAIGETLQDNAVAQQLLLNLLDYTENYRLEFRSVAADVHESPPLAGVLDDIGLKYNSVSDPLQALDSNRAKLAIFAATPPTLRALADHQDQVDQFTRAGGWIVLNGLTPEGLGDYNRLVGFDHMIRPFRRERITFPPVKNHLTAGLTAADVVLYSAEKIFSWQDGNYAASDVFSYVIDYDEVASFARFDNDFLLNMVNGFVSADAWKYIVNLPAPDQPPMDFQLRLPKPQEIRAVEWIGNTFYYPVTRFELLFDGAHPASFKTEPNNDTQSFDLDPPRSGRDITLRLADWTVLPDKRPVTGLDNIRLFATRPPDFYEKVKPLLNVGGMMEYPRGGGGILLCNLLFKEHEEAPLNALKKRTIFTTLLRNLKAPFTTGKLIIAGAGNHYEPIDLSSRANQFRDDKGWFGDKKFSFANLPTGRQKFAGVTYQIYDFPTSPVPTALMLGGHGIDLPEEIKDIPVHRQADALFFLHTARIDAPLSPDDRRKHRQFETLRYVIHYADGTTTNLPIYAEVDIADFRQKDPAPIPGAQIAWTAPYAGTDFSAVAYSKQWNNPRPNVEISTIDMVYGEQRRGLPALLALTAATSE